MTNRTFVQAMHAKISGAWSWEFVTEYLLETLAAYHKGLVGSRDLYLRVQEIERAIANHKRVQRQGLTITEQREHLAAWAAAKRGRSDSPPADGRYRG
jgi:hypothetical protein